MQIKTVVSFAAFLLTCAIPIPLAGAGVPAADVQPASADAAVTDARSAAISETAEYCDPEYGWLLTTDIDTLTKFLAENGVETDAGSAELITETVHDWFLHQPRPVSGDEDELRLRAQIYCALDRYSGRHTLGCELAWLGEAELRRYLSDAGVIVPDVSFSTVRSMISRWETGITSVKAEIPEELRAFDRELYRFTVNYYRDKYGEDAFYLPSEDRRHSFSDMSFEDQISYLTAHGVTFPDGYVDKYYTLIILAVENIERYPDSYGIALSAPQHMTVMRQMHDSINGYYGN